MITIYRLNVNELSTEIINSIKEAFKGKTIEIIVTEATDETDYLLQSEANKNINTIYFRVGNQQRNNIYS